MKKKMPNIAFRLMAKIAIPIRNLIMPPKRIFNEIEIDLGDNILDFGCGPGTYTLMAAEETGPKGKVYAVDIHPLALSMTKQKAGKLKLDNIEFILTDCQTPIFNSSLDLVVFLDVFHMLSNKKDVLREIHRILKPGSKMVFSDHHMKTDQILKELCQDGLFKLEKTDKYTFMFKKV